MRGKIFVNYRRADTLTDSFLIAAHLKDRYGKHNVFIDENLKGGQVFPQVLEERVVMTEPDLDPGGARDIREAAHLGDRVAPR